MDTDIVHTDTQDTTSDISMSDADIIQSLSGRQLAYLRDEPDLANLPPEEMLLELQGIEFVRASILLLVCMQTIYNSYGSKMSDCHRKLMEYSISAILELIEDTEEYQELSSDTY